MLATVVADPNLVPGALLFVAGGILLLVFRLWADRLESGRVNFRRAYTNDALPHVFRVGPAPLAPLAAAFSILFGSIALLPRSIAVWLAVPVLFLALLTFALCYRVPPPLMPAWMRAEIEDGTLPLSRPDALDWLLFWLVAPLLAAATVALVVLNIWYAP
jgi:hypothetical protein